jgi:predicted nucleotide-binding protein
MRKPHIFIASSSEALKHAKAIQECLDHSAHATIWTQGFFNPSQSTVDSLLNQVEDFDFAIFVFSADDVSKIRGSEHNVVRDNVIFELGLFMGRLSKQRCFIVQPRNIDMHIPTDLLGITPLSYDPLHPNP